MIRESSLAPMDIVVYYTDTITSIFERVREYGLLGAFFSKKPTRVGIVIEIADRKMILCFGKKIELKTFKMLQKRIVSVKRNLVFNDSRHLFTAQEKVTKSLVADMDKEDSLLTILKKLNKANISSSLVYLITANYVKYPKEFASFKIKLSDILDEKYGFIEMDYKGF